MKALIINDTRKGKHLGCVLVMEQIIEQCFLAGMEISNILKIDRDFESRLFEEIQCCDVIIINGEGTMHHDAPDALKIAAIGQTAKELNRPIALINTVWEENFRANALLEHCQLIAARESISQQAINLLGFSAATVPDLSFGTQLNTFNNYKKFSSNIVVLDSVKLSASLALAHYAKLNDLKYIRMGSRPSFRTYKGIKHWMKLSFISKWSPQLDSKNLSALAHASLIITGRFHGVCLAILAKRPFIAISSNTHKIEGLLNDAKLNSEAFFLLKELSYEAKIDNQILDYAVAKINLYMSNPENRMAYEKACEVYSKHALLSISALFKSIADMANPLKRLNV